MAKTKSEYRCANCDYRTARWVSKCGSCGVIGSLEEIKIADSSLRGNTIGQVQSIAQPITEISANRSIYLPTKIHELDRVLGGGCVPGAAILFSGEPGVGKSTLLLKAAAAVAKQGAKVLYVSGEESVGQVKLRAERTGCLHKQLFLASETSLAQVLGQVEAVSPDFLIVDSVQTIASDDIDGVIGGPAQVRAVAQVLVRAAKSRSMPLMLVGHVTKEGSVAGPRTLEHLVDVVCHFEGDKQSSLRFLRTLKNRFGATDEVGCFEMVGNGITEVQDPAALFISKKQEALSGSCITVALEGRRALPVEVQALVAKSSSPSVRRVTSGIDAARLAMILAVLERHLNLDLHNLDVYVATVGGIRITEPAADLAIALAIVSAVRNKPLKTHTSAVGELSLAGQVRPVVAEKQRLKEANRLGFANFIDSKQQNIGTAAAQAFAVEQIAVKAT